MVDQDWLGMAEVALLAGVSRQAVANWRSRHPDFPMPVAQLHSGPVFHRADVVRWLHDTGRGTAAMTNITNINSSELEAEPALELKVVEDDTKIHRWWKGRTAERFWLETTDREVLGENLWAPQRDDRGLEHPAYALIKEVRRGDIVLHYDTTERAIVAWSVATGSLWEEEIVWAAHGTVAREAGVQPYARPGWKHALDGPYWVEQEVTLADLRTHEPGIRMVRDTLLAGEGAPLYFPVALSDKRPLRPTQFYLTKVPADFVDLFPELRAIPRLAEESEEAERWPKPESDEVGADYKAANEEVASERRNPFAVDPDAVDRSLRAHAMLQNSFAEHLRESGRTPLSPSWTDPKFDLAWETDEGLFVAEVKSLTDENEEQQLRLGLGQVLRYRNLLSARRSPVLAVLIVEREPKDSTWKELCSELGVRLEWPDRWSAE